MFFGLPRDNEEGLTGTSEFTLIGKEISSAMIVLDSRLPPEKLLTVAVHEIGHVLKNTHFASAPRELQEAILSRHNYERNLAEQDYQHVLTNFVGLGRAQFANEPGVNPQDIPELMQKRAQYWFSLDEWMAEQLVRAQTISRSQLNAVQKWFYHLKGLFRKLFYQVRKHFPSTHQELTTRDPTTQRFKAAFEQYSATPEFEAFLNYVKKQRQGGRVQSSLEHYYKLTLQESRKESRKILERMGIQGNESAPPSSAATAEMTTYTAVLEFQSQK